MDSDEFTSGDGKEGKDTFLIYNFNNIISSSQRIWTLLWVKLHRCMFYANYYWEIINLYLFVRLQMVCLFYFMILIKL